MAQPVSRSPRPRRAVEADHDDFSRRLKISSSPAPHARSSAKLFNPSTDPIPMRHTTEPEPIFDSTSRSHRDRDHNRDTLPRQLFDPRKDDPVRFSVLARPSRDRPVSKSSGDYISASSTSSYANSVASSAFTLSSTTDGSSASSDLFDRPGGSSTRSEDGTNRYAAQLKKIYRAITNLETKIQSEDSVGRDPEDGNIARHEPRVTLKGKQPEPSSTPTSTEDLEREKWKIQIANHKQ